MTTLQNWKSMCVWIAFILLVLACITPSAASLPPTELIVTETLEPDLPSTSAATIEVTPTDCPATLCAPDMVMPPTIDKTLTPTSESDRVWSEGPLGADRLTIKFYSNPKGARCVSLTSQTTSGRQIASIGGCPTTKATVFAIRANIADSTGAFFTIVAGRAFDDQIVVMSVEFLGGDNTPAPIHDGGFADISAGKRTVLAVVPIDQYGNLVGDRFVF